MKRKRNLIYKAAHAASLVIIGILAVPAIIFFTVLWAALGLTDKLLERLGGDEL